MKSSARRLAALGPLALVLVLPLAACGTSSSSGTTPASVSGEEIELDDIVEDCDAEDLRNRETDCGFTQEEEDQQRQASGTQHRQSRPAARPAPRAAETRPARPAARSVRSGR